MAKGAELWTTTRDTRYAAALGTLGVPIRIETSLDARSGDQRTLFFLGMKSQDGRYQSKRLIALLKSGALEATDPAHEFLTGLRALQNRQRILELQKSGQMIDLRPVGQTGIWQYERGNKGLAGVPRLKGFEAIVTSDLKIAASLGLVGIPILKIEGTGNDLRYFLPRWGPEVPGGQPRADGLLLREGWIKNQDGLPPESPFTVGVFALWNRGRLVQAVDSGVQNILLRKRGTMRAAVVREDASDEAFRKAGEHLEG